MTLSNWPKLELWMDDNDGVHLTYWDWNHGEDVDYFIDPDQSVWLNSETKVNFYESLAALLEKITGSDDDDHNDD